MATGKDQQVFDAAQALADALEAAGIEVLFDDRPKVSPGVKFKDAELLGAPYILVVGRGLAEGEVELKTRATGESEALPVADAAADVTRRVRDALAG
ncbi:His/Gly/Thr/Pro-type tRNA ligase C-terminal domain-containing protein [Demequina litorisediminis]|uniref:His/Gly/Thr/Pro-type tRNA ligase C-terminal domain-containing protein n=1 Tax=Demequina litorisediminis TaxID=1849022 RepID=UPI0024E11C7B|nr:His/Gly/Thr/Pro-type tRNA ligase C-terminal domain-containing protein [Demequina litorisediminis]